VLIRSHCGKVACIWKPRDETTTMKPWAWAIKNIEIFCQPLLSNLKDCLTDLYEASRALCCKLFGNVDY
jgi:hypothetical protein